jgi:membrane-bound ClpP family serine protease
VTAQTIQTLKNPTITTILLNVSVYGVIFGTYQQINVFLILLFMFAHLVSLGIQC